MFIEFLESEEKRDFLSLAKKTMQIMQVARDEYSRGKKFNSIVKALCSD